MSYFDAYSFTTYTNHEISLKKPPGQTDYSGLIKIEYKDVTPGDARNLISTISEIAINLPLPAIGQSILPGSVRMKIGSDDYFDDYGILKNKLNQKTGEAIAAGSLNYNTKQVKLSDWPAGPNNIDIQSMVVISDPVPVQKMVFRTPISPLKSGQFSLALDLYELVDVTINGTTATNYSKIGRVTVSANAQNKLTGSKFVFGDLDSKAGVVRFELYQKMKLSDNPNLKRDSSAVKPSWWAVDNIYSEAGEEYINKPIYTTPNTARYDAMGYTFIPLDSKIIGLDPVRLPVDGRVQFIRRGDPLTITELLEFKLPTNEPNDVFNLGQVRLSDVNLYDSKNMKVDATLFSANLDSGKLTLNANFKADGYTPPFTAKFRIIDLALVKNVDISNSVTLYKPLTHDFSTNAVVSSMILAGDLQSQAINIFMQKTWGNVWSDSLIGERAESQLKSAENPIITTNDSTIEDDWALVFTGSTTVRIISKYLGEIGLGNIGQIIAPINTATGKPFWQILPEAWGTGYDPGNVLRFKTIAAQYQLWLGNAIQQHTPSPQDTFDFTLGFHANIDRIRGQ